MVAEGYKDTEIGVIPIEWNIVELGKICSINGRIGFRGYTVDDLVEKGQGAITLSPSNIINNKLDVSKCSYISNFKYEESPEIQIFNGDILLVKTASIGKTALVKNLTEKATINPQFIVLKNITSNNIFLSYIMSSPLIQKIIIKTSAGGVLQTLSQKQIAKYLIPLPPLKEQEKIADILSTADDKIDAITSQIKKAETLKKGLLQKLLSEGIGHSKLKDSEIGKIPESWEVVKVGHICNLTAGGTPSTGEKSYWFPKEVSWLSSGEVHKKKIFYTDNKISNKGLDNSSAKLLPKNSVLIALAGQGKTRGTVAITEIELTTNQSVAAILPSDKIIPYYLYFNLASRYEELRSLSTGSGGRGGLNLAILKSVHIQLPPLKEQKQIADILSTADEKLEVLRAKKEKYETLKKGLLQKLLSGEVRV